MSTPLDYIREAHVDDCISRGVHDADKCARTTFAIAEPACPDVDEHALLDRIDLAERVIKAADDVRCYPEGAFGFERLDELIAEWRKGQNTASSRLPESQP